MTATSRDDDDELRGRLVALTRDLMLIPSDASRPADVDRGLQFIKNHLESVDGVALSEYRYEGRPSILVLPKGVAKPDVLLCGHLDTIIHADLAAYTSRIQDDRIYGPGAGDMKGALAILLELFRNLHSARPSISLGLAITTDEEQGGEAGLRHLVEDIGLRCGVALIPDGGSIDAITVEEKGIIHLSIRCAGHAAHAARPWLGSNPLEKLTGGLARLRAYFDSLQTECVDHWCPTCALTIIRTENQTVNRIPLDAEAVLDIRFTPVVTQAKLLDSIRSILGDGFEIGVHISADPSHLAPDPLFKEVTEEVIGRPVRFIRADGGSDARFICRHGIPVMVSRPLVGELHSEDEWIDIDSMVTFYRIYETYIQRKVQGLLK